MAKKSPHGGKRPGAGRKPLPDSERRDRIFGIKITADEKSLLDETNAKEWARAVLCAAAAKRKKKKAQ